MSNLYDLTEAYLTLIEDDQEDEAVITTLECIQEDIQTKAQNICKLIKNIESDCEAIKKEEGRLNEKRKRMQKKSESLNDYLKSAMQAMNLKKINAGIFNVTIPAGAPKLNIFDEEALPDRYKISRSEVMIDKAALLRDVKALNDSDHIPGVDLVLTEPKVRIK